MNLSQNLLGTGCSLPGAWLCRSVFAVPLMYSPLLSQEMARDEKNYYQDTPKQIKRKISVYKNFYPEEYKDFVASLKQEKMDVQ